MYYRINNFLENWSGQAYKTTEVLAMIPEDSGTISICDEVRSLDRLAFHIPQGMVQIGIQAGLFSEVELAEDDMPQTIAETLKLYLFNHQQTADAVRDQWTDEMLTGEITMYGQQFRRGDALSLIEHHELHHISQITLIMGLAGMQPPDYTAGLRRHFERNF